MRRKEEAEGGRPGRMSAGRVGQFELKSGGCNDILQ